MASYEDVYTMTWGHFVNLFHGKYLSEANLSNKAREFMTLRQGSLFILEYVAKFDSLARFASSWVPTNQARKMKFVHGLNVDFVSQVSYDVILGMDWLDNHYAVIDCMRKFVSF